MFSYPLHYPCTFRVSMARRSLKCWVAPEMSRSRRSHGVCLVPMTFKPKDSHMLWWRWGGKKVSLEGLKRWTSWRRMFIGFATKTYMVYPMLAWHQHVNVLRCNLGVALSRSNNLYPIPTWAVKSLLFSFCVISFNFKIPSMFWIFRCDCDSNDL